MKKALLYHPPIKNSPLTTMPLAYLHLATALKKSKHKIELLDARIERNPLDSLKEKIKGKDALFISAMPGSQIETAIKACQVVQTYCSDIPIFWGGSHASLDPEGMISSPFVSGLVIGRGEHIVESILDALGDFMALERIPNVVFKNRQNEIIRGPRRSLVAQKPLTPDLSLLDSVEPYICQTRRSQRMVDYISSFGCPNHCSFCCEPVISNSRWSCIDAEVMVEEIQHLQKKYNLDGILFQDANFTASKKRLLTFCQLVIEKGIKINWVSTACLSDLYNFHDQGYLRLMQQSGCEMLFLGAEAASEETIRKYRKELKPKETAEIAELLWKEYGIFPHFSYIISYPVEDMDSVIRTLKLHLLICEILNAPTGELGFYNPTMGTPFLRENKHHFVMPRDLVGWAEFNFSTQDLYTNPSVHLRKVIFAHHIKIRRKFPEIEGYKTYDIWQDQYIARKHAGA